MPRSDSAGSRVVVQSSTCAPPVYDCINIEAITNSAASLHLTADCRHLSCPVTNYPMDGFRVLAKISQSSSSQD